MIQKEKYQQIQQELEPQQLTLVAVSKTKPNEEILALYELGHRDFGENKVQELVPKQESLPDDIRWHFIGHLQTNKVKYLTPFIHLIHSAHKLKLLKEINKQARKVDRVIDCLLEFKIAEEESKYGLDLATAREMLRSEAFQKMEHVRICGVMGMATFTDDEAQVRREFARLKNIFTTLKQEFFDQSDYFREVSMGMSGDYPIAIEEGSTMVRIGSLIFGPRNGH